MSRIRKNARIPEGYVSRIQYAKMVNATPAAVEGWIRHMKVPYVIEEGHRFVLASAPPPVQNQKDAKRLGRWRESMKRRRAIG